MESYTLENSDVVLTRVHDKGKCYNTDRCVIHKKTDHNMRVFPQHYRSDTGEMERLCPHGIGHPDPDDTRANKTHGCDGCCSETTHTIASYTEESVLVSLARNPEYWYNALNETHLWTTGKGISMVISDMDADHIRNTINFLERKSKHLAVAWLKCEGTDVHAAQVPVENLMGDTIEWLKTTPLLESLYEELRNKSNE